MSKFHLTYIRVLGLLEGTSLIALVFVAMPTKLLTHDDSFVHFFGQAHGILFLMYAFSLISFGTSARWHGRKTLIGLFCACVPFGPIWFDNKILKYVSHTNPELKGSTT